MIPYCQFSKVNSPKPAVVLTSPKADPHPTYLLKRLALSYPTPDPGTWTGTQPIQGVGQRSGDADS